MSRMLMLLTFLFLGACSKAPSPVAPDVPTLAPASVESTQSLDALAEGACKVTLEHIPTPPARGMSTVKRWFRATYHGRACYEDKQKPGSNPYYPAPIYSARPLGPGLQMWGGDHFVAYLWPNVTDGDVTLRAMAPNGNYAELLYRIPEDDF